MADYKPTSFYYKTQTNSFYLDVLGNRPVTAEPDDVTFAITAVYDQRPDLLAHDLYGNSNLWWVFAKRNPNTLKDPLFDFRAGVSIRLPKLANLKIDLGL